MKEQYSTIVTVCAHELLEGSDYNFIMLVVGVVSAAAALVPGYLAVRRFRVGRNPRISLPVDFAHAGETVMFRADGFKRFEVVELFFTGHPVAVQVPETRRLGSARVQADEKGRISEELTVPDRLPVGKNLIVAERHDVNAHPREASVDFYVRARRSEHRGG